MAVAAAAMAGAAAAPASAGWTRPVQVSAPASLEVLGTQVASSPTGAAAVSYNEVNLDSQANAAAYLALASAHGAFGSGYAVPGVQEVLAMAYAQNTLELLTAKGPVGQPCCSTVQVIRRAGGRFGPPQTLVTDAGGGTTGRLVALSDGRMLAVIAAPQRLWVSSARGAGRFGVVRGLTPNGSAPAALSVTGTPDGGSALVWTQGAGGNVFGASAGPGQTPARRHTLLTAAAGHAIDEVQLVSGPAGLTVVFTDSFNDAAGNYHSQVMAGDLTAMSKPLRPRALSAADVVASQLAMAGDGNGDEVATWEVCSNSSQTCGLQSRSRRAPVSPAPRPGARKRGRRARRVAPPWFGPASSLGQIDAGESPQLAMAGGGQALLGWITGGRVAIAAMPHGAGRFGAVRHGLSGGLAGNLALGFGPSGEAVAAWTQGTFAPDVFASRAG
jgi:hypothetical protein